MRPRNGTGGLLLSHTAVCVVALDSRVGIGPDDAISVVAKVRHLGKIQ